MIGLSKQFIVKVEISLAKTEDRGKPQPAIQHTEKGKGDAVGRSANRKHQDELNECRTHSQQECSRPIAFETADDLWIEREQVSEEKKSHQVRDRTPSSKVAPAHGIGFEIDERFNDASTDNQHDKKRFPLQQGELLQNDRSYVRLLQITEEWQHDQGKEKQQ